MLKQWNGKTAEFSFNEYHAEEMTGDVKSSFKSVNKALILSK